MIPWICCFVTHTLTHHATDELHIKIQVKLSKIQNCFWTSYYYTQTIRHMNGSHVFWCTSFVRVNMPNNNIPIDAHNLIINQFCVSETLRLIDWNFLIHPNTLIPSHNFWMTGKIGLESECWIGVGSIVIEQQLIDMDSWWSLRWIGTAFRSFEGQEDDGIERCYSRC